MGETIATTLVLVDLGLVLGCVEKLLKQTCRKVQDHKIKFRVKTRIRVKKNIEQ